MCECNCTSDRIDFVLPAPDGARYGIQIDGGCHNCQRPSVTAGVRVFLIPPENAYALDLANAPLLAIDPEEWGAFIPILTDAALKSAVEDALDYVAPIDEYDSIGDALADAIIGTRALTDAVQLTAEAREKEQTHP